MTAALTSMISTRAAAESDVPFLLALWKDGMSPRFAAHGISPSDEDPLRRLRNRFDCARIVCLEGRAVGLIKVARDGHDWQLIQILLSGENQRKGIGEFLIRNLIADARALGASLRLSVLKTNPAKELYGRLGFRVISEEQNSYEMQLWG